MKVYKYDKITKEYRGVTEAFIDKVSSIKKGKKIFIMPAYTTDIEPPMIEEGNVAIFAGDKWKILPDFRGKFIYNVGTREKKIWDKIGPLPKGYATELPERIEDLKTLYLQTMKMNFDVFISNTKLKIPSTELVFSYNSIERIKKEQSINVLMSRDDNNNVYMLTRQEYDVIINYLVVYGQFMYLQKWIIESAIKRCDDIEILKTYANKLNFKVDQKQINNLVKLTPDKRKEYFVHMADNIK